MVTVYSNVCASGALCSLERCVNRKTNLVAHLRGLIVGRPARETDKKLCVCAQKVGHFDLVSCRSGLETSPC